MSDAHREMGEYLIEDRGGIVFETSAPKYPRGSFGAMFPQAAELMEGLLAERNRLEVQLAEAIAQQDQARGMVIELEGENAKLLAEVIAVIQERDDALLAAEVATGTPCWRCGGAE